MSKPAEFSQIPVVDVSELMEGTSGHLAVAAQLGTACRESGFFYAVGHGVSLDLHRLLMEQSREFFAQRCSRSCGKRCCSSILGQRNTKSQRAQWSQTFGRFPTYQDTTSALAEPSSATASTQAISVDRPA
jgi:isopenicillin N synthase-like dioxygenase